MAVAGSITVTPTDIGGGYTKYSVAWVSSAGGAVTENTFAAKRGRIQQAKFVPDAAGTQPTDQYDATVLDSAGWDVLLGLGANRSNATASVVPALDGNAGTPGTLGFFEGGNLAPTIVNAGNAKGGTLVLIIGP